MSLLLRFQGVFGVDSYSPDTIIMVPQDVAEKSGRFEEDYASDLTDYELAEADHLDELYKEARLAELYDAHLADLFEEDQLVENQLARAKWAYPTNSELYEDDHLADMHEEVRLDALDEEAYWADELELYEEAHLAEMQLELAVKDHLLEMQLAEAKWAEETSAAEWAEEARLAACSSEGAPFSWNYDVQ